MNSPKEPPTAKRIRLAAEAMGFEVFQGATQVRTPEKLWATTANGHEAGDVRAPSRTLEAHKTVARHRSAPTQLAFEVVCAPGFHSARVVDPVGKVLELRADYSYNKAEIKSYGYTRDYADAKTAARDALYNDGKTWLKNKYAMSTAGEFYLWMDDYMDALRIDYKRLSAKKRAPKAERTLMDDFNGEDWTG